MKIYEIVEAAGVGKITTQNQTADVGPNELATQAKKFGNQVTKDGKPPVIKTNGKKTLS